MALKKKLNAVILAHNYQVPEIQDVADFVGDSLGLSQQAAKTDADVIVFCGVHFMAETAKILNPNKIVVLPDKDAGCSLEESCPAEKLAALQKTNPNFWTIAYINCSAEVKALCDVIVTSGNAIKIVNAACRRTRICCSCRTKIWARVGDGTNRAANDVVEGKLLRARGISPRRHPADAQTISTGRENRGASRRA